MAKSALLQAADSVIRFGLTPVFLSNDLELLEQLKAFLVRSTGAEVVLVQRRTYEEEITSLLVSRQLTAAWICGYPFVSYREELALVAVPVWRGRPLYQSYLIVDADRQASRLEDLEGDIHAFSDPNSNSGYLVTRAALAERQKRPEEFLPALVLHLWAPERGPGRGLGAGPERQRGRLCLGGDY